MKKRLFMLICIIILWTPLTTAQTYPKLEESYRLKLLEPPSGKVRMVLDTDTYNEIDDQLDRKSVV